MNYFVVLIAKGGGRDCTACCSRYTCTGAGSYAETLEGADTSTSARSYAEAIEGADASTSA